MVEEISRYTLPHSLLPQITTGSSLVAHRVGYMNEERGFMRSNRDNSGNTYYLRPLLSNRSVFMTVEVAPSLVRSSHQALDFVARTLFIK
jgi:hypothetical protein